MFQHGRQFGKATLVARLLSDLFTAVSNQPGHLAGSRVFLLDPLHTGTFTNEVEGIPPLPNGHFPYGMFVEPDKPV